MVRARASLVLSIAGAVVATLCVLLPVLPASAQSAPATKPAHVEETVPELLSRVVHHQLLVLPFYSVFDNLTFTIEGRKVTLSGQVLRPTLKEEAETSVRSIEGVLVVVNHIEVLPISSTDDELRRNVYRAIYEDSGLAKYAAQAIPSIHIVVKHGAVTLEGAIDSEEDKTLASKLAAGVPNVSGVHNDLIVRKRDVPAN